MSDIQLALNIENLSPADLKLVEMQKQLDEKCESMDKVRRKVFAETGELKNQVAVLRMENQELAEKLRALAPTEQWLYKTNGFLFDIQAAKAV